MVLRALSKPLVAEKEQQKQLMGWTGRWISNRIAEPPSKWDPGHIQSQWTWVWPTIWQGNFSSRCAQVHWWKAAQRDSPASRYLQGQMVKNFQCLMNSMYLSYHTPENKNSGSKIRLWTISPLRKIWSFRPYSLKSTILSSCQNTEQDLRVKWDCFRKIYTSHMSPQFHRKCAYKLSGRNRGTGKYNVLYLKS